MKSINLLLAWLAVAPLAVSAQQYRVKSSAWEKVEITEQWTGMASPHAVKTIETYKGKVDSVMSPPLGLSRIAMSAGRPESLLGNWAADVMVEGSTATGLEPADMGLVNVGGLRNNMPEGIVRAGDIYLISPFQNKLVVLEMAGSDLLQLMEDIAAVGGEAVSSSVRMVITSDGRLKKATINGEEIDRKRIYTVATLDYLAEGNDKMHALRKARKRHEIDLYTRDIMIESVIKNKIIDSKIENRITINDL